jgi:prepilin-type N-terminal cleavage/methylation domain-containing protein
VAGNEHAHSDAGADADAHEYAVELPVVHPVAAAAPDPDAEADAEPFPDAEAVADAGGSVRAMRSAVTARRGFTLVEMLVAMLLLGIVMSIAAYEIQTVVYQRMYMQSHMTAEQTARVAMSRVADDSRQMSVDITDFAQPQGPVLQPATMSTAGPILQYYETAGLVAQGSGPNPLPSPNGVPVPCYNEVTIQLVIPTPPPTLRGGELQETIVPVGSPCDMTYPSAPIVLARNVSSFTVTAIPSGSTGVPNGYQIDISAYPSDDEANIDTRMGATYRISQMITPVVFQEAH